MTKLLGLVAAAGLVPKLLAGAPASKVTAAGKDSAMIKLRPESRAVARREDTV